MTCNLLLVDDQAMIRAGVRALVSNIPGYAIIGETTDCAQLTSLAQRLQPDIRSEERRVGKECPV